MERLVRSAGLILLGWHLAAGGALAAQPFTFRLEKTNSGFAQVYGKAPFNRSGPEKINAQLVGGESSQCTDYGRKGAAQLTADTEVLKQDERSISLAVSASTLAVGGHYRDCGGCLGSNCIGIMGNDTQSQAHATAASRLALLFSGEERAADYFVDISSSSRGGNLRARLLDEAGNSIALRGTNGDPAIVRGGAGKAYYLELDLSTASLDKGGCCDDVKLVSATLDVSVRPVPILYSGSIHGYIAGGTQTNEYPNVGAILIRSRMHCTGTLIGSKTVLTAAHCLEDKYVKDIDKFTFLLGSSINATPLEGPFKITGYDIPRNNPAGYKFNSQTLEDDIGLVYLDQPPKKAQSASLHAGTPLWNAVLTNKVNLLFVGFGYNVIGQQHYGLGIKREAGWPINIVENRRVRFKSTGTNTCSGDSGGPAFLETPGALLLAAVTSGGDDQCTEGFDTRVDAYAQWLNGKIK